MLETYWREISSPSFCATTCRKSSRLSRASFCLSRAIFCSLSASYYCLRVVCACLRMFSSRSKVFCFCLRVFWSRSRVFCFSLRVFCSCLRVAHSPRRTGSPFWRVVCPAWRTAKACESCVKFSVIWSVLKAGTFGIRAVWFVMLWRHCEISIQLGCGPFRAPCPSWIFAIEVSWVERAGSNVWIGKLSAWVAGVKSRRLLHLRWFFVFGVGYFSK